VLQVGDACVSVAQHLPCLLAVPFALGMHASALSTNARQASNMYTHTISISVSRTLCLSVSLCVSLSLYLFSLSPSFAPSLPLSRALSPAPSQTSNRALIAGVCATMGRCSQEEIIKSQLPSSSLLFLFFHLLTFHIFLQVGPAQLSSASGRTFRRLLRSMPVFSALSDALVDELCGSCYIETFTSHQVTLTSESARLSLASLHIYVIFFVYTPDTH
jgi:hypothetical protein